MKRFGFTCAALILAGCGGAHEGTACQDGTPQCQDAQTALFCDNGFYRAEPCRGGCTATTVGGQPVVSCSGGNDIRSGDECDSAFTGLVGQCDLSTGTDGGFQAEVCGGDIWRATFCPTACALGTPGVGTVIDPGVCD